MKIDWNDYIDKHVQLSDQSGVTRWVWIKGYRVSQMGRPEIYCQFDNGSKRWVDANSVNLIT